VVVLPYDESMSVSALDTPAGSNGNGSAHGQELSEVEPVHHRASHRVLVLHEDRASAVSQNGNGSTDGAEHGTRAGEDGQLEGAAT
jgi:hypothetical protein